MAGMTLAARLVRKLGLRLVAAAFLAALASVQAAAQSRVELTFLSYFAIHNEALARQVVDDFNARQDRIYVDLQIASGGTTAHAEEILVRTAAGVAPDIFDVHPAQFYDFMNRGLFYDLTQALERDAEFNLDDFHPSVLESVKLNGKIYALPQRISMYVLFYNADMVAGAGLAPPSPRWDDPAWDWEALRTAGRFLRADTSGDGAIDRYGVAISTAVNMKLLPFIWQGGGDIFDRDYTELTLDQPEALRAIEFVRNGYQEQVFGTGGVAQLIRGQTAMAVDIPPTMNNLRENASFDWDVAALPMGPAGNATTMQPVPYGIAATTKHPQEALEFFKYLHSVEVGMLESQNGILLQPRRSVVTSSAFAPTPPPYHPETFLQALEVARPVPDKNLNFAQIMNVVNSALSPVWRGEVDARTALAGVKEVVAALLAEGKN